MPRETRPLEDADRLLAQSIMEREKVAKKAQPKSEKKAKVRVEARRIGLSWN
jgi:hypothetical protein